jgi:hypothetical protein
MAVESKHVVKGSESMPVVRDAGISDEERDATALMTGMRSCELTDSESMPDAGISDEERAATALMTGSLGMLSCELIAVENKHERNVDRGSESMPVIKDTRSCELMAVESKHAGRCSESMPVIKDTRSCELMAVDSKHAGRCSESMPVVRIRDEETTATALMTGSLGMRSCESIPVVRDTRSFELMAVESKHESKVDRGSESMPVVKDTRSCELMAVESKHAGRGSENILVVRESGTSDEERNSLGMRSCDLMAVESKHERKVDRGSESVPNLSATVHKCRNRRKRKRKQPQSTGVRENKT